VLVNYLRNELLCVEWDVKPYSLTLLENSDSLVNSVHCIVRDYIILAKYD